ncbi:30S ribosomal protein S12 methylthiotransferase RimO [Adlercreutzia sp. ZJ141]|uniref:30S ribosomal protein S12 methylthiotransferase RimO n=1 Tax=Adlercreutzia sp. ZJ141 TaxID=2709406 RepID=UPI0013EB8190|nr:30S ribosomal protein S12 methylthiotransferase RimO [Adlercreutzia sp. ZJ141]
MTHPSHETLPLAVSFLTLGCAKNEVDTAHMQERLAHAGFSIVNEIADADAVVVNTCSFIQSATEESIEAILDVAALDAVRCGHTKLVVAGCMPARYGDDLAAELTEASMFVPCSREDDIVSILCYLFGIDRTVGPIDDDASYGKANAAGTSALTIEAADYTLSDQEMSAVSAYVKISDGCDRFCSYCTIPYIRGRYHSFTYSDIRQEVSRSIAAGAREIVLIAQDTGRWGSDLGSDDTLASLMDRLADEFAHMWFRVMYLQPEGITDELLHVFAKHDNICNYLDIPLQHVDENLLQAMNRHGNRHEFVQLVDRIRCMLPDVVLRTTLIAGFPGETDEQFEDLCSFVEEGYFDYVGVFPYSREEGTRAAALADQIDEDEKRDRAQRVRDIADSVCSQIIAARIGRTFDVLIEGIEEDGQLFGRAMCQAPEVDGVVYVSEGNVGDVRRVTITDTLLYEMEGE